MLNKTLTVAGYIIAGIEAALKSTELANRAEKQAVEILSTVAPGNDIIADSAWTYSFLCSHLYMAMLVQSWFTAERVAKAIKLIDVAKQKAVDTWFKYYPKPLVDMDPVDLSCKTGQDRDISPVTSLSTMRKPGQLQRLRDEEVAAAKQSTLQDNQT